MRFERAGYAWLEAEPATTRGGRGQAFREAWVPDYAGGVIGILLNCWKNVRIWSRHVAASFT